MVFPPLWKKRARGGMLGKRKESAPGESLMVSSALCLFHFAFYCSGRRGQFQLHVMHARVSQCLVRFWPERSIVLKVPSSEKCHGLAPDAELAIL